MQSKQISKILAMETSESKHRQIFWRAIRRLSATGAAAAAFAITSLAADANAGARQRNEHWVATWGTALHQPDLGVPGLASAGFNNQTLRQIVHISAGGRQVRVQLSTFGARALAIGSASVALRATGSAIVAGSDRPLTFGGSPSITIPPGAPVFSDPVDFDVPALSDVAVSIFVPGSTGPASWHFQARQTAYVSTPGDFTASIALPVDASVPAALAWFWLAGLEVTASRQTGGIVAFGESVVDGVGSTADANNRWPDYLARRLMAQPGNQKMGVVNAGIAGNRLLHDSLGPNGLSRFERDVLSRAGVTHVIVQVGGNDIFTLNPAEEVTVDQLIQGHRQLINRAHANKVKVYGCTLTPVEGFLLPGTPLAVFSPAREAKRQALNAWIRTSGEYDAVLDFDSVLRDPNSPSRMRADYDSGDHGHPNDAGYKALADIIDLRLF
jgi:lysophospholipase L1-like esterase